MILCTNADLCLTTGSVVSGLLQRIETYRTPGPGNVDPIRLKTSRRVFAKTFGISE